MREVRRARAGLLEQRRRAAEHVREVRGLARVAAGVARVFLALAAPEVGRVARHRVRRLDFARDGVAAAEHEGRAARRRRGLERIARRPLRRVGADGDREVHLVRFHVRERAEHRLGARLARELEVGHVHVRTDAERFGHDGAARLHGVRVRF